METLIAKSSAHYRLLYVQPDPERGDRVCIGLLFREGVRRFSVLYDDTFAKVRCIAPDFDLDLLRFYMADLRTNVEGSNDLELTLQRYGPQVTCSSDRSVIAPVTGVIKQLLLERFALAAAHEVLQVAVAEHVAVADTVAADRKITVQNIVAFTGRVAPNLRLIPDAGPRDVLGKRIRRVGHVAAAIRGRSSIVLLDGIDLKLASAKRSITLANKVIHTFWQYGRLKADDLTQPQTVTRIGVVLNGVMPRRQQDAEAYAEAHDYALAQFKQEAEMSIDVSRPEERERLEAFLATQ